MRLRQKLFAAIMAVMVVVFLLLALASVLQGLEMQRMRQGFQKRLDVTAIRAFRLAARSDEGAFRRLAERANALDPSYIWIVGPRGSKRDEKAFVEIAREGEYALVRLQASAHFASVKSLSGLFWAVAAGTAFLMLMIYGLLLRLVLRPIDNLVAASRTLSQGSRPAKVPGESGTDEMGELVRAFNKMTGEVASSREDLEARVAEAVRDYERAQKRLVIEQRLSATGKLAAGVAHEISNPLGGMMNAARVIEKEQGLSDRAREYVGLVREGLDRIGRIVERMRSFVRPKPVVGPVDVADAVRGALSFAQHRIGDEGVDLLEEYPQDPEKAARTMGDAGEIQQVFLNIVMNALDAMRDSAQKRLRVRVAPEAERNVTEIKDTGCGMDAEQLAGAFDLFYSTKGQGGSGLGLAIAHKIVTDHGGEIELESSPGAGTTIRVRLPLEGGSDGAYAANGGSGRT